MVKSLETPMKAVIIGAGRMGRRHVQAVKLAGLAFVGISDLSESALAEAVSESVPAEFCFANSETMFEAVRPDVAVIATTAPSHAMFVRMAVEKGVRYILCEKPMAVSLAQAKEMLEICEARGVRLGVNHQMRYMDRHIASKAMLESPEIGGFTSLTMVTGNMGMAMNATHYFELFRFLSGYPPTTVQAWFDAVDLPNPRGTQFHDKAGQIRVTNAVGQRLTIDLGADQGHGITTILAGRYGQIIHDDLEGTMQVNCRKTEYRDMPTTRYGMPWDYREDRLPEADIIEPTARLLRALIHEDEWADGGCGLMTIRTLVAAYVSAERGSIPVNVADVPLCDRIFPWA